MDLSRQFLTSATCLQKRVEQNEPKALLIKEQLAFLGVTKDCWHEETIQNCVLWHSKFPGAYHLLRKSCLLALSCCSTLKRYVGACRGEVVSWLIKQRLHMKAKLRFEEINVCNGTWETLCFSANLCRYARRGSLVMDEMSIKEATIHPKQVDVCGLVNLEGAKADWGRENELATHLRALFLYDCPPTTGIAVIITATLARTPNRECLNLAI